MVIMTSLAALSNFDLSVLFFLQMAVILATCRAVGVVAKWVGQPPVVSEMIAGVVLGPSIFGAMFPEAQAWLFPAESRTVIYCVAQIGLAVYMFLIGVEFRGDLIAQRKQAAASVSIAGIAAPFALGAGLAAFMHHDARMFAEGVGAWEAVLYLGAAMSITAFPMLARIIHERGLGGTSLGTLALAAGSIDDAAAWCVLAVVLASFQSDAMIAAKAIGGGVLYAVLCLLVLRRMLRPLGTSVERSGTMSLAMLAFVLTMVMVGSWATDAMGIYAVFGAFILGAAMPRGKFASELNRMLYPAVTTLLLPLFFVNSGLNTKIGLIDSWSLAGIAAAIILAATVGKGVACFAAAKVHREPTRDAVALGALMNARGLMELIILNIGYERGLITQTLFSIMVLMAIVTTLMATPIFEWALWRGRRQDSPKLAQ
ncbi:MAG: potassium transporter [Phycisphaerae bacterium]|nr:MAG: potassium transporter [Phycisphaerae bacterium]